MVTEPTLLEKEAYSHLSEGNFEEAFKLFRRIAETYRNQGNHKQAALCFASAASCWSKKSGEKTFYNAATSYEKAAREAEESSDCEYASLLYKYAAINYERDREFINFSDSFYHSKECCRKYLTLRLISPRKIHSITTSREEKGIKGALKRIFHWIALSVSYLIWGHGERPLRTLFSGILVIFLAALLYTGGFLLKEGIIIKPHFLEAFYFSVITFTTVGYGDFVPIGLSKLVVIIEALCGLFVMPLFVIGLTRKYLRV